MEAKTECEIRSTARMTESTVPEGAVEITVSRLSVFLRILLTSLVRYPAIIFL